MSGRGRPTLKTSAAIAKAHGDAERLRKLAVEAERRGYPTNAAVWRRWATDIERGVEA